MSDTKYLLNQLVATPDNLASERAGESFMVNDVRGDTLPNSGNLATMLLLQSFYKDAAVDGTDTAAQDAAKLKLKSIRNAVDAENIYLMEAIEILSTPLGDLKKKDSTPDQEKQRVYANIRTKYGNSVDGAAVLANLLRRKANDVEFDEMIKPLVGGIIEKRKVSQPTAWGG